MTTARLVLLTVPHDFLVELFAAVAQRPPAVRVPYFDGLPLDGQLRCEGVQYNFDRRGFDVLFSHPSFAEVPAGEPPLRLGCRWTQWAALPEYERHQWYSDSRRALAAAASPTFEALYLNEWFPTPAGSLTDSGRRTKTRSELRAELDLPEPTFADIKAAMNHISRTVPKLSEDVWADRNPQPMKRDPHILAAITDLHRMRATGYAGPLTEPPHRVDDDVAPTAVVGE